MTLNLLKCQAKDVMEHDRLGILSFDEWSVAHEWTYGKVTDTLLYPQNKARNIMILRLTKPWK